MIILLQCRSGIIKNHCFLLHLPSSNYSIAAENSWSRLPCMRLTRCCKLCLVMTAWRQVPPWMCTCWHCLAIKDFCTGPFEYLIRQRIGNCTSKVRRHRKMLQIVHVRVARIAREMFDHTHITSKPRPFLHYRVCSLRLGEAGKCFLAVATAIQWEANNKISSAYLVATLIHKFYHCQS